MTQLLRLAFLEGVITTRGLYERTVLRRPEEEVMENRSQVMTMRKLFREFDSAGGVHARTVGEFLREWRLQQGLTAFAVYRRLDLPLLTYKMLENDSVSPLKVPLQTWAKIREMWKVSWGQLEEMIRASHYLMVFRPSYKGTLLRYRRKTSYTYPPDTRVSAARELYLRARLPLPPGEQQSIERFMGQLRGLVSGHGND